MPYAFKKDVIMDGIPQCHSLSLVSLAHYSSASKVVCLYTGLHLYLGLVPVDTDSLRYKAHDIDLEKSPHV